MLWEEMENYTKLTGEDSTHVPIMKIGAYLDGYDKGLEVLDRIRAEICRALSDETLDANGQLLSDVGIGLTIALSIIDRYITEF